MSTHTQRKASVPVNIAEVGGLTQGLGMPGGPRLNRAALPFLPKAQPQTEPGTRREARGAGLPAGALSSRGGLPY